LAVPAAQEVSSQPLYKDLAVALSFANICYIRVWQELLGVKPWDAYLMNEMPAPGQYWGVMANVLLAGLLLWPVVRAARTRLHLSVNLPALLLVALFLIPLNGIRPLLAGVNADLFTTALFTKASLAAKAGMGVAALLAAAAAILFRRRILMGFFAILTFLVPAVLVTFGQAAMRIANPHPQLVDGALAAVQPARPVRPRLIWIIFDEWDYRLSFEDRAKDLALPNFDRLRAESYFARQAFSPGPETSISIPALTTGRLIASERKADTNQLDILPHQTNRWINWSTEPTIFRQARAMGLNAAVAGWYHPYCRLHNESLTDCVWMPLARQHNSMGQAFAQATPNQARSLLETNSFSPFGRTLPAERHVETYHVLRAAALRMAANPDLDFVFLHLPAPHLPHAYDRRTGAFTLRHGAFDGYWHSLALADRTFGEIRQTLEQAGLWDRTTLLLSSDHANRDARGLDGKIDHRVPFLLKLPGPPQPQDDATPFNTLVSYELVQALLKGEIKSAEDVTRWLASRRQLADSPYNQHM